MSKGEIEDMPEMDFSKGERGKFYRPGMIVTLTVRARLRDSSRDLLAEEAHKRGISLEDLLSEILETEATRIQNH